MCTLHNPVGLRAEAAFVTHHVAGSLAEIMCDQAELRSTSASKGMPCTPIKSRLQAEVWFPRQWETSTLLSSLAVAIALCWAHVNCRMCMSISMQWGMHNTSRCTNQLCLDSLRNKAGLTCAALPRHHSHATVVRLQVAESERALVQRLFARKTEPFVSPPKPETCWLCHLLTFHIVILACVTSPPAWRQFMGPAHEQEDTS